jgi:hypothetical protein
MNPTPNVAQTPNDRTHPLPFADDVTAALRGAVRVARREAKARGQDRGRVVTGIGHLVDALAPGFPLDGLRRSTLEADPDLSRVLARAEARAIEASRSTVTVDDLRAALESRLRHAGTSIARVARARFRVREVAATCGLDIGTLAARIGDGEIPVAHLASTPDPAEAPDAR